MDLKDVWAALRAAWWLPAIGLVVGASASLALSLLQTPQYTARLQLFVSASAAGSTAEVLESNYFSQERVESYARLLTGEDLAQRVIDRLDLETSPGQLSGQISASAVTDTVLLEVSVSDPSPERAVQIAEGIGIEFPELVTALEAPDESNSSPIKVTVTDTPNLPSSPSSPQTSRNAVLGALLGLVAGAGVAVLRRRFDRSVKEPEEAARLAGAPVIGTVFRDESLERRHVIERASLSRTAEDYRRLRTNLQFLNVDEPPTVIMVSSALPAEGKTTAVVNLGLALADAGRRVTIVEADLRKPKVTRYLGMVGGVGLTNVLAGSADRAEVVQRYGTGELYVIAAGPLPPNPGELLASSQMSALLEQLRQENDFVLVDAPPLLPVADSTGLAVHVDGVLLSVRYGATHKEQLEQAAAALTRVGAKPLGVILNIVPPKAELARAYAYGYSYGNETPGGGAGAAPAA